MHWWKSKKNSLRCSLMDFYWWTRRPKRSNGWSVRIARKRARELRDVSAIWWWWWWQMVYPQTRIYPRKRYSKDLWGLWDTNRSTNIGLALVLINNIGLALVFIHNIGLALVLINNIGLALVLINNIGLALVLINNIGLVLVLINHIGLVLVLINKKKRICHLVEFAVSADYWVKIKGSEMINKFFDELARELKTEKHDCDSDTHCI